MKISLYKLLELIKDKKTPKKVLIHDIVFYLLENEEYYVYSTNSHDFKSWESFIDHQLNITQCLNYEVLILDDEVEIIEEDKEIELYTKNVSLHADTNLEQMTKVFEYLCDYKDKINELIQEVNKINKQLNK